MIEYTCPSFWTWMASAKPETAVAVLAAVIGAAQFLAQQRQANRRPFLQKQLSFCVEATDTAARLATETDPTVWAHLNQRFWQLYWGRLAMVEDHDLEALMVDFGNQMPKLPVRAQELPAGILEVPALMIARASRSLIAKSWRVGLPTLTGKLRAARPEGKDLKGKTAG